MPTCSGADELLEQNGITVLPDILINAGSLIGAYLEWMRNGARKITAILNWKWAGDWRTPIRK